jgi:hypothetical protein
MNLILHFDNHENIFLLNGRMFHRIVSLVLVHVHHIYKKNKKLIFFCICKIKTNPGKHDGDKNVALYVVTNVPADLDIIFMIFFNFN